jgi:lipopolysaccharide transport system ATP-binding protein
MNAIEFINVSKKFRKGEKFDSLRDFIPNLVKGAFGQNRKNGSLKDQEFWAVKDVSFELKKGEALGIIGPNGAGKSTILKMLSRIYKPTSGEIKINGKLSALLEVGAGFHPDLTGRENIYLSGAIIGMKKKEIKTKIDSIIEFSELEDFIDTPVKKYSSGMYVRLGFSVSAHLDLDILLIDEILSVGDMSFQMKCMSRMKDLIAKGTTIIFISHSLDAVKHFCSRCIILRNGQVTLTGDTAKVIKAYQDMVLSEKQHVREAVNTQDARGDKQFVHISKVKFLDSNNNEKTVFDIGEDLAIEICYTCFKKICRPTFGITITKDDVLCLASNTKDEEVLIEYIEGVGNIRVIFKSHNLNFGKYNVEIVVGDENFMIPLDRSENEYSFIVKANDRNCHGFINCQRYWKTPVATNKEK